MSGYIPNPPVKQNYDNMKGCLECILFMLGLLVGGLFTGVIIAGAYEKHIQRVAIENDCGRFNPTTGEFEWLKKQVDTTR